ncbi:LytTR family DNA-binding domain-containing protein [Hymenobacter sp. H14-R3]|uniref:LytR/AlgR family response regulator transcription factor n=1 Tax=Hymenobacter sp. H14-R3 TaxID=3046308 RepID=UPI0024BBE92D|nr:LytTR family DNA-binding domain-containing protein [Hymenobacter sp. H14-R3]MDJ0366138.1 LytTR family DNA-binding domain-containing protein [Hymenobacter sp. H14-R3]
MSIITPVKCVIVDNNEIDLYLTEHLVELNKSLHLLASFTDAHAALHFLQAHPEVELLLLDIEMPGLSGLELVQQLACPHPAVVIISTHRDFAVEAFDLHVADYLLKPVAHTRFDEAIARLPARPALASEPAPAPPAPPAELAWNLDRASHDLFVKVNNRLLRLNFDDVLYIEAMSTYSVLVTARQKHIVHYTLKSIVERLPFAHFRRVHRSYVVNTKLIDSIEDNMLTLAGHEVPLAKSYQDELYHSLRSL